MGAGKQQSKIQKNQIKKININPKNSRAKKQMEPGL